MASTEPSKTFGGPGKPSTGNTPASTALSTTIYTDLLEQSVSDKRLTDTQIYYTLSDSMLCFRVPSYIKIKYIMLDREKKRIVKQSLMKVVEAVAGGGAQIQAQQTVVLNLNLNVQSQEVHQVHPADTIYEERIRQLERKLRHADQLLRQYRELLRKLKVAASQGDAKTVLATLRTLEV